MSDVFEPLSDGTSDNLFISKVNINLNVNRFPNFCQEFPVKCQILIFLWMYNTSLVLFCFRLWWLKLELVFCFFPSKGLIGYGHRFCFRHSFCSYQSYDATSHFETTCADVLNIFKRGTGMCVCVCVKWLFPPYLYKKQKQFMSLESCLWTNFWWFN